MIIGLWFRSYLNCLVVFPTFFNLSLNFTIRSSWSEPRSAPSLFFFFFADCVELLHIWLQRIESIWFWYYNLMRSMCRAVFYVVGREHLLWPLCSFWKTLSLCPASFCSPRPNLPVNPGVSWLPTFAFQSPMKIYLTWKLGSLYSVTPTYMYFCSDLPVYMNVTKKFKWLKWNIF